MGLVGNSHRRNVDLCRRNLVDDPIRQSYLYALVESWAMSEIHFEYYEATWLGITCAVGGLAFVLLGVGALLWMFFRRRS
jgi:hypothetical protein